MSTDPSTDRPVDTSVGPSADRRPLASRDTGWARLLARRAAAAGCTPNGISIASVGFAAVAALALCTTAATAGPVGAFWLLLAALGCQLRLVCNLIDGMIAIEGGRASATGAVWNELPDRVSDVLVLAAAGVLADAATLGWAAAAMAVLSAYVRELGHRLTGIADFGGWMAKPQRMAIITLACAVGIVTRLSGTGTDTVTFRMALVLVLAGSIWVALARGRRLLDTLRSHSPR